jgi:DNA invertase Pin-like site-specific DNA recombinase
MTTTTMRTALYARVSTTDQHTAGQIARLQKYVAARGLEVAGEFVDTGISGAKDQRPALAQLVGSVRRREVDAVAVVKLDRLARSVRHLTELAAEFEALGVALIVIDGSIDTSTPSGRLLFHVLASIGEFELSLFRDRTLAGVAHARARGVKFGRPPACDRRTSDRIRRLRQQGASVRKIAGIVGVGHSTVHRLIRGG